MFQPGENTQSLMQKVRQEFSACLSRPWLLVESQLQSLHVIDHHVLKKSYPVSTSRYGLGCRQDSHKTPAGAHKIAECIGAGCAPNEIFKARKASGEKAAIITARQSSELDLILTRILWLRGLEKQKNCGGRVDSYQRYIYIHGTHEEGLLGTPASHGCVRMANHDVIELYEQVFAGTFVYIA